MLNEESNMEDMVEVLEDILEMFKQAKTQYVKQYMKLDIPKSKSFIKGMTATIVFDMLIEGVEQSIINLEVEEVEEIEGMDWENMINKIIREKGDK